MTKVFFEWLRIIVHKGESAVFFCLGMLLVDYSDFVAPY